jgi:hypothetical protein
VGQKTLFGSRKGRRSEKQGIFVDQITRLDHQEVVVWRATKEARDKLRQDATRLGVDQTGSTRENR